MGHAVADMFRQAAELNADDPRRQGNVVHLDAQDDVVVAGDIHGHRMGLAKALRYADVRANPSRRLVLQEIIHGPQDERTGHDRSMELLQRAVRLQTEHPERVLFLLGNHDVAEITGNEITKDGRGYCKSFQAGLEYLYEDAAGEVREALEAFLLSLPLAVRCPNGVWLSHSLPSPNRMEEAGTEILDRATTPDDLRRGRGAYEWTWGRRQSTEQVEKLAEQLGVRFFVLGHQPCEQGSQQVGRRVLLLASDHSRGCLLHFRADEPLDAGNVAAHIRRLIAIGR